MARKIHRLSALNVSKAKRRGLYADGGGLYLQVGASGGKSWLFRFMLAGRSRGMGLGSLHTVSLADARDEAAQCRQVLRSKIDPIEARNIIRGEKELEAAKSITFEQCAEAYILAHKAGWKNAKHHQQWENTLATYAHAVLGRLLVASVDTTLIMRCLEPIWALKPETASRLRGRIESILDWATVRGYRMGENPARWRGHLDKLLPARAKVKAVEHHAALPYDEMPGFIADLREFSTSSAIRLALEFLILTAARTSEVLLAQWDEIDEEAKVWTVPASRMKARKEHRVPLSSRCLEILREARKSSGAYKHLFPSPLDARKPLSSMAFLMLLRRMSHNVTAHGFRSSFRDWAAEKTNTPHEVCEMALAHTIGNKAEAAYRRGDLFERRRELMQAWSRYCDTAKRQKVVALARAVKNR